MGRLRTTQPEASVASPHHGREVAPFASSHSRAWSTFGRCASQRAEGNHLLAYWLAVLCLAGGTANTIAAAVIFNTSSSSFLSPRTPAFTNWRFGTLPDTTQTFTSALISLGVGVGFALSAFRFTLFREPDIRRLDFFMMLFQFQNLLWYTLRSCMVLAASSGLQASIRETFSQGIIIAMYLACAPPRHHALFYASLIGMVFLVLGIADRGIEAGVNGQFQFGVALQPVLDRVTARYLAYALVTQCAQVFYSWFCAYSVPGNDLWSRRVMFFVGASQPVAMLSLQLLRYVLFPRESQPGNTVFVSDIYTAFAVVFVYTIQPHLFLYSRIRCVDTFNILERRVVTLKHRAALSNAIAGAQKEFTRYIFHEVRGPLTNLSLSIELLASSPVIQENPELHELVKLMGLSTSTVRSITDDVLFIAKVESGEFNLIFTPIELRSVVSSTVKLLGHTAAAKKVLLSTNVDPDIPAVLLGVGNRLQQVLTNITSNAIKFVPEERGRVNIRARVTSAHLHAVDPHEVAAVVKNSATSLAEAESDIGEQALALGLATGQFSRSLTPSTMASCPADAAPRSTGHQGQTFARLRAAGKRALGSVIQATRTAAVTPAAPSNADSGASDIDESVTTAASHACDPRVPFESSSSFLVVDLPPSFVPLSTIVIVRFEVEDNGCGISEEHIAQLFKPYSQVGNSHGRHEHGGTGLGLYISMKLVQQMGGRIGVESAGDGRGTTFWFEVPLRGLAPAIAVSGLPTVAVAMPGADDSICLSGAGVVAEVSSAAVSTLGDLGSSVTPRRTAFHGLSAAPPSTDGDSVVQPISDALHILLVDDVASIRMLMRRLLVQHVRGAVIVEASDGERACEIMADAKATASPLFSRGVVCMDKEMPRCDGFVATQRIRAMGFRGLVLGVTGNAIAADISDFLRHGADAIVTKPVSFRILMGHLRAFAEVRLEQDGVSTQ